MAEYDIDAAASPLPWTSVRGQRKHREAAFLQDRNGEFVGKIYGHDGVPRDANTKLVLNAVNDTVLREARKRIAELEAELEDENKAIGEFQDWIHIWFREEHDIDVDGSGSDTCDWRDLTKDEVKQGVSTIVDQRDEARARVAALEAELAAKEAQIEKAVNEAAEMMETIRAAGREKTNEARGIAWKHGGHKFRCLARDNDGPCTCGYDEARATMEKWDDE